MKKLTFNLSLVFIVISVVINTTSIKANAGGNNALGSTDDSSSYSGQSFSPENQNVNQQLAPDVSNSVEFKGGQITVSSTIQSRVNEVASGLLNQVAVNEAISINNSENSSIADGDGDKTVNTRDGNNENRINETVISPKAAIIAILLKETSGSEAISQIRNILTEAGVSSVLVETLINSMQGMISNSSAALPGIPVANKLQSAQLVASNKSLAAGVLLAQNSQSNVDINKLSAAINAYNEIIMKSDAKTLKKLAGNPDFMAIRNILNQFRTALNY